MKLAHREVYQTAVGLVTAQYHCNVSPLGGRAPGITPPPGVSYTLRAEVGDRVVEGWGETKEIAKRKFELTLEKWLSEGAP
jgi:hypothetical protein